MSLALRRRLAGIGALILLGTLALSWMVFPYLIDGRSALGETGRTIKMGKIERLESITNALRRLYRTPNGVELTATFATADYFRLSERSDDTLLYDPADYFLFIVAETVHVGQLPRRLPDFTLLRPDDANFKPAYVEGPNDADHHRVSFVYFAKKTDDGRDVLPGDGSPFRLVLENEGERRTRYVGWFEWTYPYQLSKSLLERKLFTPWILITLSFGLLAASLTPCMLQLSIMYIAVLGATGSEAVENANRRSGGRPVGFAVAFVSGFVVLFGAIGALVGWSGQQMQIALSRYATEISIVAGGFVLAFGIYLAYRARMPVICRLPFGRLDDVVQKHSMLSSALLAIGYSLGCVTCFGGAVIGSLAIYVGALESPTVGAALMATFALVIGLPFLLAAVFMSRVQPALELLSQWQRPMQWITAVVVLFFGVVLVTDNYHTVSDFLYPLLGLS